MASASEIQVDRGTTDGNESVWRHDQRAGLGSALTDSLKLLFSQHTGWAVLARKSKINDLIFAGVSTAYQEVPPAPTTVIGEQVTPTLTSRPSRTIPRSPRSKDVKILEL